MNEKHKKIAEDLYKITLFALTETGKEYPVFCLIKDNKAMPVLMPPGEEIDVSNYILMSMDLARQYDVDALILVAGMWSVTSPIEEIDPRVRPSEHPNREHYLNLIYMTADGSEMESIAGKIETDQCRIQAERTGDDY